MSAILSFIMKDNEIPNSCFTFLKPFQSQCNMLGKDMENKPSPNPTVMSQIPLETNGLLGVCFYLLETVKGHGITDTGFNKLLISKYYVEAQQLLSNFISFVIIKQRKYNFFYYQIAFVHVVSGCQIWVIRCEAMKVERG